MRNEIDILVDRRAEHTWDMHIYHHAQMNTDQQNEKYTTIG